MHAPDGRASCWILLVVVPLLFGCRGANQMGRYVQVTETSNADLPAIDVPPQRLTTAKPRVTDPLASSPSVSDPGGDPHAAVPAATLPAATKPGSTRPAATKPGSTYDESPTTAHLADLRPTSNSAPSTEAASVPDSIPARAAASRLPANASGAASAASNGETVLSLSSSADESSSPSGSPGGANAGDSSVAQGTLGSPADAAELLAVIQQFPPELRQQALRQFIATAARSAGQTDQPNALLTELAKSMSNLPTLPQPAENPSAIPPQRIAASGQQQDEAPAVASISDAVPTGRPSGNAPAAASLSDMASDTLEPVEVEPISAAAPKQTSEVTPASAARSADETTMVSQALAGSEPNPAGQASSIATADSSTPKSFSVEQLLDELVDRLSANSPEESEADRTARLIKLRHLMVLAGDPDSAVARIDGMAEAEQEYLRHHLLGLWTMIDPQGHPVPSRRFTSAIPQIREAAKFAAAATDTLEVRSLAFCTEIESYGQFTPFPGNRFKPGQQVILYCEIENFTVKGVENGYETHLKGSYDVFNSKNEKVFSQVLPADQQVSANFLRDYFIAYQMFLPAELAPGTYRLQLTMEDANGKKYGQDNIPFEVAR